MIRGWPKWYHDCQDQELNCSFAIALWWLHLKEVVKKEDLWDPFSHVITTSYLFWSVLPGVLDPSLENSIPFNSINLTSINPIQNSTPIISNIHQYSILLYPPVDFFCVRCPARALQTSGACRRSDGSGPQRSRWKSSRTALGWWEDPRESKGDYMGLLL